MPVTDLSGNGLIPNVGGGPSSEVAASGSVFAITPSDSAELSRPVRGIYVGGAGDVAVECADRSTATFVAPPIGSILPVQAVKVLSTGTTATNLVGLS